MDTIKVQKNQVFDTQKLHNYLKSNLNLTYTIDSFVISQFIHGQSNPTFLIVINGKKIVLRKKPNGNLLKGAHQIDREFKIISSLYKERFPVPEPLLYCNDQSVIGTEFYVMSYVEGRIFSFFLPFFINL